MCKFSCGHRFSVLWGICLPGGRVAESRGVQLRGSCQTAFRRVIPVYILTSDGGSAFSTSSPTLVLFRAFLLSTPILLSSYLVPALGVGGTGAQMLRLPRQSRGDTDRKRWRSWRGERRKSHGALVRARDKWEASRGGTGSVGRAPPLPPPSTRVPGKGDGQGAKVPQCCRLKSPLPCLTSAHTACSFRAESSSPAHGPAAQARRGD